MPPDLLPAARLIARASESSQVIVVSHASRLINALEQQPDCHSLTLAKEFGETNIAGLRALDAPPWAWAAR